MEELSERYSPDVDDLRCGARLFAGEGEGGRKGERARRTDCCRRESPPLDIVRGVRSGEDGITRVPSGGDEDGGRVVGESVVRRGAGEEQKVFGRGGCRVEMVRDGGDGGAESFSLD